MAGFRHWAAQMETAESDAWGGFLLNSRISIQQTKIHLK